MVFVVVLAAVASTSSGAAANITPRTGTAGKNAVLPAVMNAAYGGYTTALYVENVSHLMQAAHVTITYYNQTGAVVGMGDSGTISFWAEMTFRQDNGHSFTAGNAGWGMLTSDQEVAVFVNEFAPGPAADGSSYTSIQVPGGTGTTLYAPAIAKNAYGGYTTGIGLANVGSNSANIMVNYHDQTGMLVTQQMVTVPANGYAGLYSGDPMLSLPDGFTGTATIINTSPMPTTLAAIVNETGPGGQFSSYDAVAVLANTLYAAAAMNHAYGGYNTGMGIQNPTSGIATVTITYYDAMGGVAGAVMKTVPAFGYVGVYQGGADGPPISSSGYTAVISSPTALAAIVNEVAPSGTLSTSLNTETAGSGYLNFALVENAGSDGWSTGLAVINVTNASVSFNLIYFDAGSGGFINSYPITLAAHAYLGRYTPSDLPMTGTRATAFLSSMTAGLAGIANEAGTGTLMSYNGQ